MGELLAGRVERGVGLSLAVLLAAGATACGEAAGNEGISEPSPAITSGKPSATSTLFKGTVVNASDHRGINVGVRTYVGPNSPAEAGHQDGGAQPSADCIAPGRTVIDKDVPANVPPTESSSWYRLVADQDGNRINPEWIGDGYYRVQTPGTVPECTPAQIAGK